jgi:hypothetical protein
MSLGLEKWNSLEWVTSLYDDYCEVYAKKEVRIEPLYLLYLGYFYPLLPRESVSTLLDRYCSIRL